ncbi:MAG TPA: cupin domain-containing protein [Acidimicrobiales bacterium]|jgi:hypothetical protein
MRRVVAGVNEMGRSYVVSDEDLADEALLWSTDLAQGDGAAEVERLDPAHVVTAFEPPPGGHRWVMGVFPPESDPDLAASRRQIPGMDERGVHGTRTIDYDLVLDGSLQLDLDEGSVELHAGDAAVLVAAPHGWRNTGDRPARLLALLASLV